MSKDLIIQSDNSQLTLTAGPCLEGQFYLSMSSDDYNGHGVYADIALSDQEMQDLIDHMQSHLNKRKLTAENKISNFVNYLKTNKIDFQVNCNPDGWGYIGLKVNGEFFDEISWDYANSGYTQLSFESLLINQKKKT